MTGAHGLVGRYGEERAVNDPAFNARPGIVTRVLFPHTTAATGPSWGIPPPVAGQHPCRRQRWASAVVAPGGCRAAHGG